MRRLGGRVLVLLLIVVLGGAAVALHPQRAAACSCRGITTATALRQADVAFSGRVVALDRIDRPRPGRTDIRFAVDRVYKGTAYAEQLVASSQDSASCGLTPQVGSRWVIFATLGVEGEGDDTVNRLRTNLCSGNLPGGSAPLTFRDGRPPRAGASDREERAIRADAAVTRWFGVAGIGAVAVLGLAAAGVALAWRRNGTG